MTTQRGRQGSAQESPHTIRAAYERYGAARYYQECGAQYRNPHEEACSAALAAARARWPLDLGNVLDLACGSGEMTIALRHAGCAAVTGIDPYTGAAYAARTASEAEPLTFAQIAAGALEGRHYTLIVCSFALHLAEPSRMPLLSYRLSRCSGTLLVLSPHKRPLLRPEWGLALYEEFVVQRVHTRLYKRAEGPGDRLS